MQASSSAGKSSSSGSRGMASKALTIQEYKRRLRDNIKSIHENFTNIVTAAKVSPDDLAHKNPCGRMAELATTKYEMEARAALMVRACDELLKLTNDLKEFLILHDFNFLTEAIQSAEETCDERMKEQAKHYNALRVEITNVVGDIDKDLHENHCLRP